MLEGNLKIIGVYPRLIKEQGIGTFWQFLALVPEKKIKTVSR